MIVEKRTYRMQSGQMRSYLEAFEQGGFALQRQHLGSCVGFYISETGPIEEVTQMFAYENWADRDARRDTLYGDERFRRISDPLWPKIADKNTQILKPVSFWRPGDR